MGQRIPVEVLFLLWYPHTTHPVCQSSLLVQIDWKSYNSYCFNLSSWSKSLHLLPLSLLFSPVPRMASLLLLKYVRHPVSGFLYFSSLFPDSFMICCFISFMFLRCYFCSEVYPHGTPCLIFLLYISPYHSYILLSLFTVVKLYESKMFVSQVPATVPGTFFSLSVLILLFKKPLWLSWCRANFISFCSHFDFLPFHFLGSNLFFFWFLEIDA